MTHAPPSLLEITQLTRQELTATRHNDDPIRECGRAALALLSQDPGFAVRLAYQKLHDVPYKDVKTCWRRLYVDASLWSVVGIAEGRGADVMEEEEEGIEREDGTTGGDWVDEVVKALDLALILTAAPTREELIELWFSALQGYLSSSRDAKHTPIDSDAETNTTRPSKRRKLSQTASLPSRFPTSLPTTQPTLRYPIPRAQAPSLEAFQKKMDKPETHTPLIITCAIHHWPALEERPWSSPAYLMQQTLGGRRLVPVEIGRSYTDDGWGQRIVTFREFMHTYMLCPPHTARHSEATDQCGDEVQTGYLAQHDLFAQIPGLRADISVPDYCYCTPVPSTSCSTTTSLDEPLLNAWFGPANTISPLHTDPYHNILAQVVGYKYIRLYAPSETSRLYPRGVEEGGVDMGNTSLVDLEEVEGCVAGGGGDEKEGSGLEREERRKAFEEKFPGFKDARYVEGILGPGECLYLPVGWWHYVRSLTTSFSVSFWFS